MALHIMTVLSRRVRSQLLASFLAVMALASISGLYGLRVENQLNAALGHTYNESLIGSRSIQQAQAKVATERAEVLSYVSLLSANGSPIDVTLKQLRADAKRALDTFAAHEHTQATTKQLKVLQAELPAYETLLDNVTEDKGGLTSTLLSDARASDRAYRALNSVFDTLVGLTLEAGQHDYARAKHTADFSRRLTIGLLVVAAFAAVTAAMLLARRFESPILRLLTALTLVAEGDLTPRLAVKGRDELAEMAAAFNMALDQVRDAVTDIEATAEIIASAGEELSAISMQMSATAEEASSQASALWRAVEVMDGNVQSVASGAEELSASIVDIARSAERVSSDGVEAAATSRAAAAEVARFVRSAEEIATVLTSIRGIARKTHLLALNATIEAAAAGESSRGFTVIAQEVKELATAASDATESIAPRVQSLQEDSTSVRDAFSVIQSTVDTIQQAQATIASAVEQQRATTNDIARATAESARGSGEIALTVRGVAEGARATSQGAVDTRAAAASLASAAARLQIQVAKFTLDPEN
jgi:methyl-accepting chemotaxis protein